MGGMAQTGGMGGVGGTGGMGAGGMSVGGSGGMGGCMPGVGKACYSGPAGTENVGACKGGATLCQADGMSYGPCLGEVTPVVEDCASSTVDDDCNGMVNEHCGIWAKRAGFTLEQRTQGVATDSQGNVVITGRMFGSADFGGGMLTSAGGYDFFVAKFDKDGNHLWSKIFGGTTDDEAVAIATDSAGNVFLTGYFTGTMSIGATNLTATDTSDGFVIKLDSMGAVAGHAILSGLGSQLSTSIVVDSMGGVFVAGDFDTQINTGVGQLTSFDLLDGFIVKYDNTLSPLWHKSFGGSGDDHANGLARDSMNNLYVTGSYNGTVDFGGGPLPNGGGTDAFVAKLNPVGTHVLSKGFATNGNQSPKSIAVNAAGEIFIYGEFTTQIDLGGGVVLAAGLADLFLTKLDPTATHVFTKVYGDLEDQAPHGMAVDSAGDVVFSMSLEGTVDFGGGPLVNAGPAGNSDVVVVKLSSSGSYRWSRRYGATNDQDSRAIAVDGMNNIFVGGELGGTMNFGPVTITASSSDDAFIAKLEP